MKVYKTEEEMMKDVVNGTLSVEDSITLEFNMSNRISIDASDIKALNINAWAINAGDINAWDINARDINAGDINARDIKARDINAWNINARDISYYAFCTAYKSIKCKTWKKGKENGLDPVCLDGELTIIKEDKVKITCEGKEVEISRESAKALNLI